MRIAPAVAAFVLAVTDAAADRPALTELLEKAGRYVTGFERDFASVISDETAVQRESLSEAARGRVRTINRSRTIQSETLFVWIAEEKSWLTVRNVVRVDRKPVPDSRARIERAIAGAAPGALIGRIRQLRDESTRFNLGLIRRNFSDPILPLQVLDPAYQTRFEFALSGAEPIDGVAAWKVTFAEKGPPTIVVVDGRWSLAAGAVWLTDSGIVLRTTLVLGDTVSNVSASMTVSYALDRKLGGWVPARMDEVYSQAPARPGSITSTGDHITCAATYSNYRKFETSGRILDPK